MSIDGRIVEICVLAATAVFAVAALKAFRNRHTVSRWITIVLAGICISSLFLFFPRYLDQSRELIQDKHHLYHPVLRSLAYTLFYSLKAISGGQEIDVMEGLILSSVHPVIRCLYFALNYGFLIAAPLLTSSLVLSLIGDLADQFRCRICGKRRHHVFSELNRDALSLAEKIRARYPKERIVFCDTRNVEKDLQSEAKKLGALRLYASCISEKLHLGKGHIQFYLISSDEDTNLCYAEKLILRYRNRPRGTCTINAFAQSGTGIQMVENMARGSIGVRFVDATALFCSDLMLKYPLYELSEGTGPVSVAIVGCDKLGMRLLKTIAWCGVTDGHDLKIRVYDKNAEYLEKKLKAQCPELMEHCDLTFTMADAQTSDLEAHMLDPRTGSTDATYIVLAMGEDDLNIEIAERLSQRFRHHNQYARMPRILVRIRNRAKAEVFRDQDDSYLKQMAICPFGGTNDVFAEGILRHSYLDHMAFAADLCYRGLLPEQDPMAMTDRELRDYFAREKVQTAWNEFLHSEYNRRSSMAAALHIPTKLHSCGILPAGQRLPTTDDARRFAEALADDPMLVEKLAKNEHLRWSQFLRSEGYVQATWEDLLVFYPVLKEKNNQDTLGKRHLCLAEWEQLDALNQKYLQLDPPVKKDFKKSDYDLIRGIPTILLLAKRMEKITPEAPA